MADVLTDADLAALERSTWSSEQEQSALTPEILGRMVAWAIYVQDGEAALNASSEKMFEVLTRTNKKAPMPASISSIVHFRARVDGIHVDEMTRMLVGAQSSYTIGRLNPDTTAPIFKVDRIVAAQTLSSFEKFFPEEVRWLREELATREEMAA